MKGIIESLESSDVKLASLVGRYYTMDRDNRWERIKIGYDLLVHGMGERTKHILNTMQKSYDIGVTDEFIKPIVMVDDNNQPIALIDNDDVVICFNFRTDRLRQITSALSQQDFQEYDMKAMSLKYFTMTRYDSSFKNVKIIYDKENLTNTIGEIVANKELRQLRIAETEKYAHVTFFLSGGRENVFENEERVLIPSPKVATYDMQPEMSAFIVRDALIDQINRDYHDFIAVNFANGDMVGHTGIYAAIEKAVETIDICIGDVVKAAKLKNYTVIIIADHGNADYAVNNDGSPNTAHSLNPVPCVLISDKYSAIKDGILADVAPTIIDLMEIEKPIEMTGKSLL